jgi:hypothetical protein
MELLIKMMIDVKYGLKSIFMPFGRLNKKVVMLGDSITGLFMITLNGQRSSFTVKNFRCEGYKMKFGLYENDFQTQKRTLRNGSKILLQYIEDTKKKRGI